MNVRIGDIIDCESCTIRVIRILKKENTFYEVQYKFIDSNDLHFGRLPYAYFKNNKYKIIKTKKEPINEVEVLDCFKENENNQYE